MTISRKWAMPNSNTFSIPPIRELVSRYTARHDKNQVIVDPFANSCKIGLLRCFIYCTPCGEVIKSELISLYSLSNAFSNAPMPEK